MLISHVRWTMRIIGYFQKAFKVLACTPDSSALVVDMKGLFLEGSAFTKPFPSTSANGYYGFVSRDHSLQSDKSAIFGCIGFRKSYKCT